MDGPQEPTLQVVEALGGRLHEAAAALTGSRDRGRRYLAHLVAQGLRADAALALADRDGRLHAAAVLTTHAGRTAMVAITAPRSAREAQHWAPLASAALTRAASLDVDVLQALVDPSHRHTTTLLELGGLRTIGTLAYLERSLSAPLPAPIAEQTGQLRITMWDPSDRAGLEQLLEASYIDTRDCPGLAQMRRTCDIIDGHVATGAHDPSMWWILHDAQGACGLALLSPVPTADCVEVVYFGLSPRVRGRGLSRTLLRHALDALAGRRERTVALACDEGNAAALRLYRSFGFARRLSRVALVAAVRPASAASAGRLVHSR
jgi:ribosomal protein S18 acetylase RimI-like enzyme